MLASKNHKKLMLAPKNSEKLLLAPTNSHKKFYIFLVKNANEQKTS
jgi:hypothetical protein